MGWLDRRVRRTLALALTFVWIATLAFADTAVTPSMHCRRGHMPCCPQSSGGESCSGARCTEQVPEKTEARVVQPRNDESHAVAPPARCKGALRSAPALTPELTTSLHGRAGVFRLKDDLRI
jgi:hypothetical protein